MLTVTLGRCVARHYTARTFQRCASPSFSTSSRNRNKEKYVIESPFPKEELPKEPLPHLIFNRAAQWSHCDAIECSITGRTYTYGGMIDRALRWGAVVDRVLPPSSSSTFRNVVIFSQNVPEFPIILLGTQVVGATFTTMSPLYTVAEAARQLSDCDAQMVVVDPKLENVLRAAFEELHISLPVFVNGLSDYGSPNLQEIIEDTSKPFATPADISTESISTILYSGGTTGRPKGVAISHRAMTSNLACMGQPGSIFPFSIPSNNQHVIMGLLPFFHVSGALVVCLLSLHLGAKIVTMPGFDPLNFIKVIKEPKMETLTLVPPLMLFLAKSPAVTSKDLDRVRYVFVGGASVPVPNAIALKEKAKNLQFIQEGYGMTEGLILQATPLGQERLGWCGQMIPNAEGKVVDLTTGESLPEGQKGEMCIRSPSLMSYYYKNPKATAETIDSEGWLHTGDVAIHQDGNFCIVDRIKELVKVKGYQVSPSELEDELLMHPGVVDAGVVGVEDERAGELPRAYIVRKSEDVSEEQLMKHMENRLAPYKQLKGGIQFVDSLPKTPTGKLLRRQLKEMVASDN